MRSGDGHVTELVDDAIEPVEIPMVFDGLEAISAEDGKGHGVDAGLAHQADVVIPDFLRPLVGTIVATESDAASVRGQQFWPYEVTSCTHGYLLWQAAQGHGPYRIPADRHSWPIVDTPPGSGPTAGTDMGMFMTADRRNEQARPPRTASCGSGGRALWEGWEREISS